MRLKSIASSMLFPERRRAGEAGLSSWSRFGVDDDARGERSSGEEPSRAVSPLSEEVDGERERDPCEERWRRRSAHLLLLFARESGGRADRPKGLDGRLGPSTTIEAGLMIATASGVMSEVNLLSTSLDSRSEKGLCFSLSVEDDVVPDDCESTRMVGMGTAAYVDEIGTWWSASDDESE